MNISKLKLVNDGLKGIEVDFLKNQEKNRFTYFNEYHVKEKSPVHAEFKKAMDALEKHYRLIMNVGELTDVKINGVTASQEKILIMATVTVFGYYATAANTPLLDGDCGYKEWSKLSDCVDKLYTEAVVYMEGGKSAEPKQYLLDLFDKEDKGMAKRELSAADIRKMDKEGQFNLMRELLEERGAIVVMSEEMESGAIPQTQAEMDAEIGTEKDETVFG